MSAYTSHNDDATHQQTVGHTSEISGHDDRDDTASFHTASSRESEEEAPQEGASILEEEETGHDESVHYAAQSTGTATTTAASATTTTGDTGASNADTKNEDENEDVSTSDEEDHHGDVFRDEEQAKDQKRKGNEYFKAKDHANAIPCYTNAIALCPRTDEEKENRAIYHCNRAACYYGMVCTLHHFSTFACS